MSATCPCCGGAVSPLDLIVDADRGRIVYRERSAALTRQEMRVFAALHDAYPRVRSKEDLLFACAADGQSEPEAKIVDVVVCKLRRKLDPLGLVVTTAWGLGYALELGEAEKAAVLRAQRFAETRRGRRLADRTDIAAIAMMRAQGLPLTAISERLCLAYSVVAAAIDGAAPAPSRGART